MQLLDLNSVWYILWILRQRICSYNFLHLDLDKCTYSSKIKGYKRVFWVRSYYVYDFNIISPCFHWSVLKVIKLLWVVVNIMECLTAGEHWLQRNNLKPIQITDEYWFYFSTRYEWKHLVNFELTSILLYKTSKWYDAVFICLMRNTWIV